MRYLRRRALRAANWIAARLGLPRLAKGGTAPSSGLILVTGCDIGRHPRTAVEKVIALKEFTDTQWYLCNSCARYFKEAP